MKSEFIGVSAFKNVGEHDHLPCRFELHLRGLRQPELSVEIRVAFADGRHIHPIFALPLDHEITTVQKEVAALRGFEPRLTDSESVVLPLDERAISARQYTSHFILPFILRTQQQPKASTRRRINAIYCDFWLNTRKSEALQKDLVLKGYDPRASATKRNLSSLKSK